MFGEQAQIELAFGGKPRAVAVAAEGMGDAADHADLAERRIVLAVRADIAPALGGFALGAGGQRDHRKLALQQLDDLVGRQHLVHAPAVGGAHIHVFDEAQRDARAAEMPRHRQDLVVVRATFDDHVDLDVLEADLAGGLDAGEHLGDRKVHVVHAAEDRVVQTIQTHRHAREPGIAQRLRLAGEQRAVGGEREVGHLAVERAQVGELNNELFDVLAQQRLAARQSDLAHAHAHELAREPGDFLEAQQGAVRQIRIVLVEHILGHAVRAAEVAAIGDADAQIPQRSLVGIAQLRGKVQRRAFGHDGGQCAFALIDDGNDAFCHVGVFLFSTTACA